MTQRTIEEIKIVEISRNDRTGQEFIKALNQGQQQLELTRWVDSGEVQLQAGKFYRGYVSPRPASDSKNPDKPRNAPFKLITPIDGFGGVETPHDDEPKSQTPDERQRLIILQALLKDISIYYQNRSEQICMCELLDELEPVYLKFMDIANKLKAEGV